MCVLTLNALLDSEIWNFVRMYTLPAEKTSIFQVKIRFFEEKKSLLDFYNEVKQKLKNETIFLERLNIIQNL